ncbi:JHBP domain containing protein, partial [Asbolus verrucosus]
MTAVQGAIKQLENPIPELGLPSLEPVRDSHLTIAPGPNIMRIEQNFENFDSYGFSTANVSKFDIINMECTVPEVKIEFDYHFDGNILLIPVKGSGPGKINACKY